MATAIRSKSVRRITLLAADPAGGFTSTTLYDRNDDRKKRKVKKLRPLERLVRQIANAQSTSSQSFLARHDNSRRKRKRNAWLRDLGRNATRAHRKGQKKIKIARIFA